MTDYCYRFLLISGTTQTAGDITSSMIPPNITNVSLYPTTYKQKEENRPANLVIELWLIWPERVHKDPSQVVGQNMDKQPSAPRVLTLQKRKRNLLYIITASELIIVHRSRKKTYIHRLHLSSRSVAKNCLSSRARLA